MKTYKAQYMTRQGEWVDFMPVRMIESETEIGASAQLLEFMKKRLRNTVVANRPTNDIRVVEVSS